MKKETVIVVDAGNTKIKVGYFRNGELVEVLRFSTNQHAEFAVYAERLNSPPIFISSVLEKTALKEFIGQLRNVHVLKMDMNFPVDIAYGTPETLGMDRLVNACSAQKLQPFGPKVIIDMGTCIKFDFVDDRGTYHGGSISPGLEMRLKALNHFTGKLPLLSVEKFDHTYIGKNSKDSIFAGVYQGIQGELNHFISRYLQEYQGLTFFVTGGDAKFFEFPVKNNIFANENLTLTGLYEIYLMNA